MLPVKSVKLIIVIALFRGHLNDAIFYRLDKGLKIEV